MFKLMDVVNIKELKIRGLVMAITEDRMGTWYTVRYFDNAEPRTVGLVESELEKIPDEKLS